MKLFLIVLSIFWHVKMKLFLTVYMFFCVVLGRTYV